LHEVHRAAGAKMVDFGGWEMRAGAVSGLLYEHGGFVDDVLVQRGQH
jgi:glycine cleavage system aminomethyltransferase T